METEGSELDRQGELAESERTSWLSIDKNMYGFMLEAKGSEVGRRCGFSESEFKPWLSMNKKMY